jgi:hypothetical protein
LPYILNGTYTIGHTPLENNEENSNTTKNLAWLSIPKPLAKSTSTKERERPVPNSMKFQTEMSIKGKCNCIPYLLHY